MRGLGRVLLTGILCVLLVGFGLCGAYGTVSGLSVANDFRRGDGLLMTSLGATGLAIAWLSAIAIVRLWRKLPTSGE